MIQIFSITLVILEEFLVNSIFHYTKIILVDMKVLVYSNFSKKWKKMKSLSSMRNGRFHPPKCRGKVQKIGVLYTHSPKMLGPSPNFLITPKKKLKKPKNCRAVLVCQTVGQERRVTAGRPPLLHGCPKHPFCKKFLLPPIHLLFTCGQLLLVGSNTCLPCPDFS
jgi:hypothetical protein